MAISEQQIEKAAAIARQFGAKRLILFGSALHSPDSAEDLDLACDGVDGWRFYELGGRIEDEIRVPLDLIPLSPPSRFTHLIEREGKRLI
ncbi:MAG TPA: nucleotidyltransferase domain-containing protein [bacterium]|nr:nucleotidyltransferase domain-containing protein [bacterium]HQL63075.1 nucleotidyltransferase domain-containing protein [bacterium]